MVADRLFGRKVFENQEYRHSFLSPEGAATADAANDRLFVWVDPSKWGVAPAALRGRSVALIANSPVVGRGPTIDSFDEVIRINRMEYWKRSAADDGARITMWAGLADARMIRGVRPTGRAPVGLTNFPDVASTVRTIWSATPFHLSVRFYKFLSDRGLLDRLFVSGSEPFLHDYLAQRLPPGMARALAMERRVHKPGRSTIIQPAFELLLTGTRLILFCALSGARQIGLFGFNFFEGTEKKPISLHDYPFEKELLAALIEVAPRLGSQIVRFDP